MSFTDPIKVAIKKVWSADFQTLLDDLGRELIHAVLGREAQDMVGGAGAVRDRPVFTDVLDTPIAKLAMGYHIDACKHLVDTWTLGSISM